MGEPRVLHLWSDYSPALFDHSHPFCLENGIASQLVAGNYIETGMGTAPRNVVRLRTRSARAQESGLLRWRVVRRAQRVLFWPRLEVVAVRNKLRFQPTVMHFHYGTTAAGMLRFLRHTKTPAVVSFYGVDASAALRDPSCAQRYTEIYQRASRLIVLCNAVAERLQAHGCPAEKITVLNLPAGVEQYPFRERTPITATTRFIIAARFVDKKGYPTLLHALSRVVRVRSDVHLTMFGYGPTTLVRRLMAQLDLDAYCTLIEDGQRDFVQRFRALLSEHDVFVLPSTTSKTGDDEGGPALSLVAAQAAGLPVIATAFPGAELSVLHERTGLLANTDDSESLAACMLALCGRPDRWAAMGREGARIARAEFSRETQCRRLIDIYRDEGR